MSVFLLPPPYIKLSAPLDLARLRQTAVPDGTLTVLRLRRAVTPWLIESWLPIARRQLRRCTFVLQLVGYNDDYEVADMLLLCAPSGIRACILGDAISPSHLRASLSDAVRMDERLLDWIGHATSHDSGVVTEIGHAIFRESSSGDSIRNRLFNMGLPSPMRWRQLARAMPALLRLQMNTHLSVEAAALAFRFPDHGSFWRLSKSLFGISPARVRGTLGWEWLADRWLRKHSRSEQIRGSGTLGSDPGKSDIKARFADRYVEDMGACGTGGIECR